MHHRSNLPKAIEGRQHDAPRQKFPLTVNT